MPIRSAFCTPTELCAWAEEHPRLVASVERQWSKWRRSQWTLRSWCREIVGVDQRVLILYEGSTVLTTSRVILVDPGTAVISSVFTNPTRRREGLGRINVTTLIQLALRTFQINTFVLYVKNGVQGAAELYKALGFKKLAVSEEHDATVFELTDGAVKRSAGRRARLMKVVF